MARFNDVSEVEAVLQALQERESGPLVARLPREPGRRESRYMHLFGNEPIPQAAAEDQAAQEASSEAGSETLESRVARLESELGALRAEIEELKARGG
jgi:hypothetical protein